MTRAIALLLVAIPLTMAAQQPSLPPVHPIGRIEATAADSFQSLNSGVFRVLSDGRVIFPGGNKRLLLLDKNLQNPRIILDTSSTARFRYPAGIGQGLVSYRGDTTLMWDDDAESWLMLDERGTPVRSMHSPKQFTGGPADPQGRLYYLDEAGSMARVPKPVAVGQPVVFQVDSQPIVRFNPATGRIDTVATIRAADLFSPVLQVYPDGSEHPAATLPVRRYVDVWTVLHDGTVAIVRAHDYRIDRIAPDGRRSSSPKLAHDWVRIPDSVTAALLDSIRAANAARHATVQTIVGGVKQSQPYTVGVPALDQIPDYDSPITGGVFADPAGTLWIQEAPTSASSIPPLPAVYDIVTRDGRMIDRVSIPAGAKLLAVSTDVVYMSSRLGKWYSLVRARIR